MLTNLIFIHIVTLVQKLFLFSCDSIKLNELCNYLFTTDSIKLLHLGKVYRKLIFFLSLY